VLRETNTLNSNIRETLIKERMVEKTLTKAAITEELINNCYNREQTERISELLAGDSNKEELKRLADERSKLIVIGPSSSAKEQAIKVKLDGNQSVSAGDFRTAIKQYTEAIKLDPTEACHFGNRSLANLKLGRNAKALDDAKASIKIDKDYAKGYQRLAEVYLALKKYKEAYYALKASLIKDPGNAKIKQLVEETKKIMAEKKITITEAEARNKAMELTLGMNLDEKLEESESKATKEDTKLKSTTASKAKVIDNKEDKKAPISSKERTSLTGSKCTEEVKAKESKRVKTEKPQEDIKGESKEYEKSFEEFVLNKDKARSLFQGGQYKEAIDEYKSCLRVLDKLRATNSTIPKVEFESRSVVINNNIAICYKQNKSHKDIINYTTKVINSPYAIKELKVKAYTLRAQANEAIEMLTLAKDDWVKVKELQPDNKEAAKAISRIGSVLEEENLVDEINDELETFKQKGNELFKASNDIK
jgi:tetratricopeptide (TPR) repeat protein